MKEDTFTDGSVSKDFGGQLSKALNRFRVALDAESGQSLVIPHLNNNLKLYEQTIIISGMGELHLDIYVERIRREYKVDATVGKPRVNFKEIVTQGAEFDYLHKKQSGGQGQYGRLLISSAKRPSSSNGRHVLCNFWSMIEAISMTMANYGDELKDRRDGIVQWLYSSTVIIGPRRIVGSEPQSSRPKSRGKLSRNPLLKHEARR
ncbi:hypothetical protein RJ640_003471 [Escallonia rubra]|uniref:Elongation Factor G domain-containing protein n=1 Tax=Escallonia rubra TaxID=112253 RepID=A0AA88QIY1_9ASTE|nr:hypothetical protein RJ640_003471 [Escallonia rubra]